MPPKVLRRKKAKILRPVFPRQGDRCAPPAPQAVAFRRDELMALLVREGRKRLGVPEGSAARYSVGVRDGVSKAGDTQIVAVVELESLPNVIPFRRLAKASRKPKW